MDRDNWGSKAEFLLACIGYCVGLGNLWRFPYLVYESGGGVFLIPYFIMLFLVGIPLLYMELSIGLITQRGPVHSIKALCPFFKGTGYATVVMSFLYGSYFTTIIVYCLFYFFNSFHAVLPWTYCHEDVDNKTTLNWWASNNCTDATMNQTDNSVPVTQDYFDNFLLHKTSGIEEFGSIRWELFGLLILTWVLIYFFVFRGTKSIGKIVWFTAIFPYIMLTALLIRGCTLTGAMEGIEYFLGLNGKGDWSKLKDIQVWVNATSQIFNSIGIGFGSLITFSSFNRQNKTILRDTLFIATINSLTSLMSGFIIFSVLGHISVMVGQDITELATQGPELVFVAYPQALSEMMPPALWSTMFFFCLFVLGIDSVFSSVECCNNALEDILHNQGYKAVRKEFIALAVCAVAFCLALPNVFDGGIYFYKLMDWYTCVQSLAIMAAVEVVVVLWIYGSTNLCKDVHMATGKRPPTVFEWLWWTLTPVLVVVIMVFSIIGYSKITYGDYEYPSWAEGLGWGLACISLVCIPIGAVHEVFFGESNDTIYKESFTKRLVSSFKPQRWAFYGITTSSMKPAYDELRIHSDEIKTPFDSKLDFELKTDL